MYSGHTKPVVNEGPKFGKRLFKKPGYVKFIVTTLMRGFQVIDVKIEVAPSDNPGMEAK